ncbi:MAG TPA: tripartite tricarboxylate transporter substrate binding protein [Burkholderiaceae bacterium]|nr:tripartite tricarboxylate transporter substrate binding protein [Burkholderiaceae bacterium]
MIRLRRRRFIRQASALAGAAVLPAARAQEVYPSRPIRLIVPFGPGGATDIMARVLSQQLTKNLGQPVVVENKPGGNAIIGTTTVMRSPPDGYTLLITTINFGANPALFREKLPFDPLKDFTLISHIVNVPTVLSVHPSVKARSAAELIQLAKSRPGEMNFGSAGYGTINHLAGELLKSMAGIEMVHVPYKSGGAVVTALVGGEINMLFATTPSALPFIKDGRIVPLAASGTAPIAQLPQVTPLATVVPGFSVNDWQGIVGPPGMPRALVDTLQREITAALRDPAVVKRVDELGSEVVASTPEQFHTHLRAEVAKWMKVSDQTGMRAQE